MALTQRVYLLLNPLSKTSDVFFEAPNKKLNHTKHEEELYVGGSRYARMGPFGSKGISGLSLEPVACSKWAENSVVPGCPCEAGMCESG